MVLLSRLTASVRHQLLLALSCSLVFLIAVSNSSFFLSTMCIVLVARAPGEVMPFLTYGIPCFCDCLCKNIYKSYEPLSDQTPCEASSAALSHPSCWEHTNCVQQAHPVCIQGNEVSTTGSASRSSSPANWIWDKSLLLIRIKASEEGSLSQEESG